MGDVFWKSLLDESWGDSVVSNGEDLVKKGFQFAAELYHQHVGRAEGSFARRTIHWDGSSVKAVFLVRYRSCCVENSSCLSRLPVESPSRTKPKPFLSFSGTRSAVAFGVAIEERF